MKNLSLKIFSAFALMLIVLSTSCKVGNDVDPDDVIQVTVSAADFTDTIAENPVLGQRIGFLMGETNHQFQDEQYMLVSQNPMGAISVVPSTGEILVNNPSAFDFELNTPITAMVRVSNFDKVDSATIMIVVTDVFEVLSVQERLDYNQTPISIYNSDTTLSEASFLGKMYQGAIIASFDTLSGNGILVAKEDQGTLTWGCEGVNINTAAMIGDGNANTQNIVSNCMDTLIAARICSDLDLAGSTDWYLPSADELNLVHMNVHMNGAGNFSNQAYWTSTQNDDNTAFFQIFNNTANNTGSNNKSGTAKVRAIRGY